MRPEVKRMNPLRTILIHLKGRRYKGAGKTVFRYFQVKSWKYLKKPVRVSIRDYEQVKLVMYPGCDVSEKLYVVGLYDTEEGMKTLQRLMKPNEVFYDVGANIGPFSLLAHSLGVSVYAFEGHPETAKRCMENFVINGIDPERVFSTAVSDFDGRVSFSDVIGSSINRILDSGGAEVNSIQVPSITLDTFALDHKIPTVVKIDTKGHELPVILGMKSILKNGRLKYITFEANGLSSRSDLHAVHDILSDAGFMVGNIDWDHGVFIEKNDLGEKSPTGDYIAFNKSFIILLRDQGIRIEKDSLREFTRRVRKL